MKTSTIKKVLREKMNDWLSTITDKQLARDLHDGLLVSGGSIASMFLGEHVNDYDVYLSDMDLVKRVALYYTKTFGNDMEVLDGRNKASYLKRLEEWESLGNGAHLAIESLKPDQIKILVKDGSGYKVTTEYPEGTKYTPAFFSPNAISLTDDLQIVLRFYGDHTEVHKTFDFIHATNYFTFNEGLVTNVRALECLLSKTLIYQGSLYPLTSIIRAKKFIKRGYNISAGEYLKIMFQISGMPLTDVNVLEEQLIGVDVAYFGVLISILRSQAKKETDEVLTSEKLNLIIDMLFNGMGDGEED